MSDFDCLDKESEILLESLISENNSNNVLTGATIAYLVENGYVNADKKEWIFSTEPEYTIQNLTQKGKSYFELKKNYEKSQKKLSRREWKIAIVSAIIGGLIGLIPSIINWIGGI